MDPRLLRHARTSRSGVALLALLGVCQAAVTLGLVVALSRLVVGFAENAHEGGSSARPVGPLALLAGVFVGRAVLAWLEQVVAQRTAARVAEELRTAVLAAALRRGPAWVAGFGAGRLSALLTGGLETLRPWFSGYLPALVLAVLLPPGVVVTMLLTDPASALIALVTLPLVPLFGALIGIATQRRAAEQWQASARLSGHFLDVVRGLATLRLFGRAQRQIGVVEEMTDQHRAATVRVLRLAFLSSTALDLVATLSVGLIAVEAGLRVAAGDLGLGPALLVILLAPEAYRPLREVGARFHASADAAAVIAEVDEVLVGVPIRDAGSTTGAPGVLASGLRVRHPAAAMDALALPSLRVAAGELVALRGASGAGKTTVLRVLAGLQPLTAGLMHRTGPRPLYLPQLPTLPHARTIADALLLDGETRSNTALFESLAVTGLAAEVAALPAGLDTPLGERGQGLSSGQRQRLALARLLRAARQAPPSLLLLDEPTAHLDPAAEATVIAELRAAAIHGHAVVVVAHRPALLAAAHRTVLVTAPVPPSAPAAPPAEPRSVVLPAARVVRGLGRRPGTAVLLGAGSWLAGVVLTGAAAWLLVRASTLPPVLTLSVAVVTVRASAVARPMLRYLERLVSHEVAFSRLGAWRAAVYRDLLPRVPGAVLHRRGDLLTRVVEDVDTQVDGLLRGRLPAASAALALGCAGIAAFVLLPAAGLALAAGLLVAGGLAPALAARQFARTDAATARARSELADAVLETVDGIEELAGRGTDAALAVPRERSRTLARLEAAAARTAGSATALAQVGLGIAVTGVGWVVASAVGPASGLSAELAGVLLFGVVALAEPVLVLPDAAIARRQAAGARSRLAALTTAPPSADPAGPAGPGSDGWVADLRVRGLTAGWDPRRAPALRDFDLDLPAGARVAVLGPSGAGKSTLAAILGGLLDPVGGTVRYGGRIGLVGDGVDHVFASTLRENLRLAGPGATDGELRAALSQVRLGDWLAALPNSLDTWLGEGATTISGGELRRLVTARALLADPALLVLDEPTEGLDGPTAADLMADLLSAASGRSVLLLTHRTEGLDQVDAVYHLVGGALREVSAGEFAPARVPG